MKVTELKFAELKELIETCGKNGVRELSLKDFKVVFGSQTKEIPLTPTVYQTKEAEVQSQLVEKEALTQASHELDENDLAVMQVEDPVRYEQLMIEREIEDDRSRSGITDIEQSVADEHTGQKT